MSDKQSPTHRVAPLLWFLLFALSLWGFYEASLSYQAFRIVEGEGINHVHHSDLTFSLWFFLFGMVGVAALTRALAASRVPEQVEGAIRRLATRRRLLVAGLSLGALGVMLFLRHFVLKHAPVADDESTYVFIAKTLLHGRVINPLPGDNEFFANQFILFNSEGWYGKYPIGHPLLLALGEAVGLRILVVPLVSFASLLATYAIGRRFFGELEAILAVGLLALSPQFLLTAATELSQPTSALCMLLGLYATVRLSESERWPWAVAAGVAWAYGILTRPLPGALFLTAAALWYLFSRGERSWGAHLRKRVPRALVALLPVLVCGAVMYWVNIQQTGSAVKSGYHAEHGGLYFFGNKDGQLSLSVAASFLRQNLWLFGWPISFAFLPFGRSRQAGALIWALIGAEYFYRILVPKTVVVTTGPIYVMEVVPLLALLTASGMIRATHWLEAHRIQAAKTWVTAFVLASTVVGYTMFVPVRVRNIHLSTKVWNEVFYALERRGASKKALVFSLHMAPTGTSWAYYPPPPSPSLDDDIIFVRIPLVKHQYRRCLEFWKRRYPTYSAWTFHPKKGLEPLERRLRRTKQRPRRVPGRAASPR